MALPLVGLVARHVLPKVAGELLPKAAKEGGQELGEKLTKKAGEKLVDKGVDVATKKALDGLVDKLPGSSAEVIRKTLEDMFTKGGGALIQQGFNLAKKGFGDEVADAVSTMVKTGRFASLGNDQAVALGNAVYKVAKLASNLI